MRRSLVLFVLVSGVLLATMHASSNPGYQPANVVVKVLSEGSYQFQGPPLAPTNCNWQDYDAHCLHSRPKTYVENTMVVQEPSGESLEIACTVYNRWSHCSSLPINQSFHARMEKHGLEIRSSDQHGKTRKQVYEILRENGKGTS
jgi:hypothetical protein